MELDLELTKLRFKEWLKKFGMTLMLIIMGTSQNSKWEDSFKKLSNSQAFGTSFKIMNSINFSQVSISPKMEQSRNLKWNYSYWRWVNKTKIIKLSFTKWTLANNYNTLIKSTMKFIYKKVIANNLHSGFVEANKIKTKSTYKT